MLGPRSGVIYSKDNEENGSVTGQEDVPNACVHQVWLASGILQRKKKNIIKGKGASERETAVLFCRCQ